MIRVYIPSTRLVRRVTLAAFLRPAGRLIPIFSSLSRNTFPPSLDFARRRTPPSREALRHSGGDNRRCTSATVTLYLEVEESKDSLPGVEQKMSVGRTEVSWPSLFWSLVLMAGNSPSSSSFISS